MYKIKDFSIEVNTSEATLRYYDEIGLFKPEYVDFYTGYRYYQDNQIKTIYKINKLKEIGLSLNEIKEYLKNNDKKILIDKKKKYERMIDKMNEIINDNNTYKIIKSDYKKFIELNGLLNSSCALGLEIKDNNADYYYILENDRLLNDFGIYKEEKWITLNNKYLKNEELIKSIFNEIKNDYDNINIIIPEDQIELINYINNKYNCIIEDVKQREFKYKKINIKL